jgi:cytochrome c biogenesis protein
MPTDVVDPLATEDRVTQPALGPLGAGRWMWRQLTSMRTALILLFLLALAAIPGSVFPQRGVSPIRVVQFLQAHQTTGPWLDRLSFFDVYASPWFAAIYLLLMVSLAGCILPRCWHYARHVRSVPPTAPRNLSRMPEHRSFTTGEPVADALDSAERVLRQSRFRLRQRSASDDAISAEKGYLHEIGNLIFHLSLLVLLVGVVWGSWWGYRGTVVVIEGEGFSNTLTQYDDFSPGRGFSTQLLTPFSFTLDSFDATFLRSGPRTGQPDSYTADVTYRPSPDAAEQTKTIGVNRPLEVDGAKVYLLGSGYAPNFTVRDGKGDVVFSGPIASLPQDAAFTSMTVVKVPDAQPEQLGFNVTVAPTAPKSKNINPATGPRSLFPEDDNPRVYLGGWVGDLGLNNGAPQNIYQLDTSDMKQIGRESLAPGETWQLPGGRGSITFKGLSQFANFQVAADPGRGLALIAVLAALIGICLSLLVRRRRVWVRATQEADGSTLIEVAGLAPTEWSALGDEVDEVSSQLGAERPEREATEVVT